MSPWYGFVHVNLFIALLQPPHVIPLFKTDVWTVALLCQIGPSLMEGLEVVVCWHFTFYGFQMCVSLCMCVSLPSCWVQSSMVLKARDPCRSNSAGLISSTNKQMTKSCFSCKAEPLCSLQGLIDAASKNADISSGYLAPQSFSH